MMSRIIHLPYIFVLRFNLNNFCRFIPKFYHSRQDTDTLACSAFLCNFVFMLRLAFQATPDISETILRACIHVKQIQKLQQMIVWFWWSFQISVWLAAFCACGPGFAFYNSHVSMAKKQLEVISSGNLFDRDQDLNPGFPFSGCFPHSRMRGTDGSVRVWEGRREQHRGLGPWRECGTISGVTAIGHVRALGNLLAESIVCVWVRVCLSVYFGRCIQIVWVGLLGFLRVFEKSLQAPADFVSGRWLPLASPWAGLAVASPLALGECAVWEEMRVCLGSQPRRAGFCPGSVLAASPPLLLCMALTENHRNQRWI